MTKQVNNDITNVRNMNLIAIFAALTAIGAFIRIPLPYIPITLQTIFVLMAGIILGGEMAAFSQIIYVILGLIGIPIFTEGGGPAYILKPSFGYLLGFIATAYIIGKITEKREINYTNAFMASCLGIIITYSIGVPYLYLILNHVSGIKISFLGTIKAGMIVFLPGDIIKVLFVTITAPLIKKRLKRYLPLAILI